MSGTRPSGSTLGSQPARHCLPLPPRRQWRRGRGHLPSSIRAQRLLSIPRGSPGNCHHSMIPSNLYPPLTGFPNRPTSPPQRSYEGLHFATMHDPPPIVDPTFTRPREAPRPPVRVQSLYPEHMQVQLSTEARNNLYRQSNNWRAKNRPPLEIGPKILGRPNGHGRRLPLPPPPGSTPRPTRRRNSRSLPSPPTNDSKLSGTTRAPSPVLITGLDHPHGDRRGVTPPASSPLHR
jgi:hypothetical protein